MDQGHDISYMTISHMLSYFWTIPNHSLACANQKQCNKVEEEEKTHTYNDQPGQRDITKNAHLFDRSVKILRHAFIII